jgi:hypothetical protein
VPGSLRAPDRATDPQSLAASRPETGATLSLEFDMTPEAARDLAGLLMQAAAGIEPDRVDAQSTP